MTQTAVAEKGRLTVEEHDIVAEPTWQRMDPDAGFFGSGQGEPGFVYIILYGLQVDTVRGVVELSAMMESDPLLEAVVPFLFMVLSKCIER